MSFNDKQQQVDERISRHPEGYRPDDKMLDKLEKEREEIQEALAIYDADPTPENMKELKIEIGDELFALICLANSKGISLDECFDLMMEKNREREKRWYQKE